MKRVSLHDLLISFMKRVSLHDLLISFMKRASLHDLLHIVNSAQLGPCCAYCVYEFGVCF